MALADFEIDSTVQGRVIEPSHLGLARYAPKTEHKASPFVYPSGIPGMGNYISGPSISGSSTKALTTLSNITKTSTKRKADELESEETDTNNATLNLSSSKQRSSSNDSVDAQQPPNLSNLIQEVRDCLSPYTDFHPSCNATEPIKKIHASLSSPTLTPMAVMSLLYDAYKILKALAERQGITYSNLEPLRSVAEIRYAFVAGRRS